MMGVTQTEGRLVESAAGQASAEGDPARLPDVVSFAALYRSEYRGLVSVALGLTGSRETAEDIAQEALLSLHRRWERGDAVDNPAAYVRRACTNLSASWMRKRMAEARAFLRIGTSQGSVPAVDESTESFWSEVRRLPRRQAQVVALFYGYDMSVAEISETLQMAAGTTKTHLHRGRRTLATRLGVDAPETEEVG